MVETSVIPPSSVHERGLAVDPTMLVTGTSSVYAGGDCTDILGMHEGVVSGDTAHDFKLRTHYSLILRRS